MLQAENKEQVYTVLMIKNSNIYKALIFVPGAV